MPIRIYKELGMRELFLFCIVLNSFLFALPYPSHATDLTLNNTQAQVCFSPKGGCTEAIIKELNNAESEILVQAYSFTSAPIIKALLNSHKKKIKVEVILDKSQRQEKYTIATFLANAGISTFIDDKHAIAHNKIMIIDKETVITGSFNFTKAAEEKNAENLLIIRNKDLAKVYLQNWYTHREHSERYLRR